MWNDLKSTSLGANGSISTNLLARLASTRKWSNTIRKYNDFKIFALSCKAPNFKSNITFDVQLWRDTFCYPWWRLLSSRKFFIQRPGWKLYFPWCTATTSQTGRRIHGNARTLILFYIDTGEMSQRCLKWRNFLSRHDVKTFCLFFVHIINLVNFPSLFSVFSVFYTNIGSAAPEFDLNDASFARIFTHVLSGVENMLIPTNLKIVHHSKEANTMLTQKPAQ